MFPAAAPQEQNRTEGKKAIREQGCAPFWGMSTPHGSCDALNESQQRERPWSSLAGVIQADLKPQVDPGHTQQGEKHHGFRSTPTGNQFIED